MQLDGNLTGISEATTGDNNDSIDASDYDTEDEAFPEPIPANLYPVFGQNPHPGEPLRFDVDFKSEQSSYLPLCLMLNSRSVFNKCDNLREMLQQIGPDICLASETWERERKRLNTDDIFIQEICTHVNERT